MHETMFVNGRDLNSQKGAVRAGVIPFTVRENRLHFLLGIDRRTRELTDFGGGVKSHETMVGAAHRELEEESCGLFESIIKESQLQSSPAISNSERNTAIFFLRIDPEWLDTAEQIFSKKQQALAEIKKHNELIGVKWVAQEDFKLIAFNRRSQCMWKRVQNILRWNTTWNELRLQLMLGPELTNAVKTSWNYLTRKNLEDQLVQRMVVSQSCS